MKAYRVLEDFSAKLVNDTAISPIRKGEVIGVIEDYFGKLTFKILGDYFKVVDNTLYEAHVVYKILEFIQEC